MKMVLGGLLFACIAVSSEAAVITIHSDTLQLSASATGCGTLVHTASGEVRGTVPCTSHGGSVQAPLLGSGLLEAAAAPESSYWHALARSTPIANGADLYVRARTNFLETGRNAPCGTDVCRVDTDAIAEAAIRWNAIFDVRGGDSSIFLAMGVFVSDPFTFVIDDLTTGQRVETRSARTALLNGHRYAVAFDVRNVGTICERSCTSSFGVQFDTDVTVRRVPEPGTLGILAVGLLGVVSARRLRSRKNVREPSTSSLP